MAGNNDLSREELENMIRRILEFNEGPPDGVKIPPGLLENLGLTPTNIEGGMKATNVRKGEPRHESGLGLDVREGRPTELHTKRVCFLKEKARALASKAEFYEASKLLEDITGSGDNVDLGTKLLMVECYLQLGRENRANKCMEYIEKALKSNPLLPANDLVELAGDLLKDSGYVRAMVITNISADVFLSSSANADEILSGVFRSYRKLGKTVKAMLWKGGRSSTIAADVGLESMIEMLEKLGKIRNCNRDQQVVKEAMCCRLLDRNYNILRDFKKCIKFGNLGVTKMEQHFTVLVAQRYRIYGSQLKNLAISHGNLEKFDESEALYLKSIEAKENARDYDNEAERKADLDDTKRGLKKLRGVVG